MYVSNIVVKGRIFGKIDDKIFNQTLSKLKRCKAKFKSIRFRDSTKIKGGAVFYLFKSGSFVCLGFKNYKFFIEKILPSFCKRLVAINMIPPDPAATCEYEIVSMVGCDRLPRKINLHKFLLEHVETDALKRNKYNFNAEIFPAAYLYINDCVVKLFASGKYNIVGAKCKNQIKITRKIFLQDWISDYLRNRKN